MKAYFENDNYYIVTETAPEIFMGFLVRDFGFKLKEAEAEMNLVHSVPNRECYIRASRKGATVALNRKLRHSIYSAYENAINHATIIAEMKSA